MYTHIHTHKYTYLLSTGKKIRLEINQDIQGVM